MGQERNSKGIIPSISATGLAVLRRLGGLRIHGQGIDSSFQQILGNWVLNWAMDEIDKMNNTYLLRSIALGAMYCDNDFRHVPAAAPGAEKRHESHSSESATVAVNRRLPPLTVCLLWLHCF